jgi:ADP-heptose:LPS heptosyltransferase
MITGSTNNGTISATILISPFSQKLRNGFQQNAKNYPHWQNLITALRATGVVKEIWQIGIANEYRFEGAIHKFNLPLDEVEKLARQCSVWISVDNFLPHLCNAQKVPTKGVVIFSKSDPKHYGYPQYINLLKDKKYLRADQFHIWENCDFSEEAFVDVETVKNAVLSLLKKK